MALKYNVGNWVKVTVRREGAPDFVRVGKIVEATRDYAVAEIVTNDGPFRFTSSEDTFGYIHFARMTGADWARRRR